MGSSYGSGYGIGQGWYRSYINVYGSSSTNTTYTYKVNIAGQLKNIDGWSSSRIQLGTWNGSSYSWSTKADGNMYCSWSADWNWTNFNYTYTYTVNRSTSAWNAWHGSSVQCGSGTWSTTTNYVTIPALPSYAVSYNSNSTYNSYTNSAVSNTPGGQTKYYGVNLTLSSTKPTKATTTANTCVVTLDPNYTGKSATTQTVEDVHTYTFSKWNTNASGTGTDYAAGGTYTGNAAVTLYAIWDQTITQRKVVLPDLTRAGFTFLGWSDVKTDKTAKYIAGEDYVPPSDITLYGIWRANLSEGYTLKAVATQVDSSNRATITWNELISTQTTQGSTLYEAGGQYGGWELDSSGNVTVFGVAIKLNGLTLVKGTDKVIRGGLYYYYNTKLEG